MTTFTLNAVRNKLFDYATGAATKIRPSKGSYMPAVVISDIGGTVLFPRCGLVVDAMRNTMASNGYPVHERMVRRFLGMPKKETFYHCLRNTFFIESDEADLESTKMDAQLEEQLHDCIERCDPPSQIIPGARHMLAELDRRNDVVVFDTGFSRETVDVIARKFGPHLDLGPYLDPFASSPRPHSEAVTNVLDVLRDSGLVEVDVEKALVVKFGDTPSDMQSGKKAGVLTVGFNEERTVEKSEELYGAGADIVVDNLVDLPPLVLMQSFIKHKAAMRTLKNN